MPEKRDIGVLLFKSLFTIVAPIAWTLVWANASWQSFKSAREDHAAATALATMSRTPEAGKDVILDTTVAPGPTVRAAFSEKDCIAAKTVVTIGGAYYDIHNKRQYSSARVATRRSGPESLVLVTAEGTRVEVPADALTGFDADVEEGLTEIPPRLQISEAELASARERLHSSASAQLSVTEYLVQAGSPVVVVGHLEENAGTLRVGPSRALGHVEVRPGTAADLLAKRRGNAESIVPWIFAGLATIPTLVVLVVFSVRRGRRKQQASVPA